MAQFYKMTIHICDLEDNLNIKEIERLIEDKALNGISTSAICHFSEEKKGDRIEWDDDIDVNYRDCPTSAWEKYFN